MGADVSERLIEAWTDEVQAVVVYRLIAERERDPQRAAVLRKLADIEVSHRSRLESRMRELEIEIPDERGVGISTWRRLQARFAPVDRLIARQEAMEQAIAAEIDEHPTGDADTDRLLEEIRDEETQHTVALAHLRAGTLPSGEAGLFGAIGSALSMATGAYLAERSVAEVAAANLAREREEVLKHPEEEKEELSLFYQLKGLTAEEADMVVERIAEDPERLFRAVAIEEFGSADAERGDAVQAALAGGLSTAVGAMVPVLPFFWLTGTAGVIVAAAVSLVAHFAVGAAKSLFTLRTAWSAGIEMTIAGAIVGGATYLLGLGIGT